MSHVFPSMPPHDPPSPDDRSGYANVRIEDSTVVLELAGGQRAVIPFDTVERRGIIVAPGSDHDVNRVYLCLLASEVSVDDAGEADLQVHYGRSSLMPYDGMVQDRRA